MAQGSKIAGTGSSGERVDIGVEGDALKSHISTSVATSDTRTTRYIDTIGYAAGLTGVATFTEEEAVTRYRFKPSAAMRAVEDAANVAQAESWLNTGAADTASSSADQNHYIVAADTWSEWQEFPEDTYLSNVYFGLDAAGTGATVEVEAE